MKNQVLIYWLGHSCFQLVANEYKVVLDPYQENYVPGLAKLQVSAHEIFCSHEHLDHCSIHSVIKLPKPVVNPFHITTISSYHDHELGQKRGKNRITILEVNDMKIVHMGDQGCLPDSSQIEQIKAADVLLIPVGGYYTIDAFEAKQIIDLTNPKVVIPMHYRTDEFGYSAIAKVDEFVELMDNTIYYDTNSITIDKNSHKQTAILSLKTD